MSGQQQQQSNPVKPQKIGAPKESFTGSPTASMLKGLYQGPKALKTFGLIKGAKVGSALGKMPMRTKMKTTTPSRAMVEKSVRKTKGY